MKDWPKVRIVATPGGGARVFIDDVQLHGVRSIGVEFTLPGEGLPSVKLVLYPTELVFEGEVQVERVTLCPLCKQTQKEA